MRKTTLVTLQGKKAMCHAECIVLTNSQYEKLTCDELAKRVDGLAKDFHVDWSIECNGNVSVINITRTTTATIDDAFCHELEMDATNFMSAIDKMELSKPEPECPSHDNADETDAENLAFVDSLIEDEESIRKNFRGIEVMAPYKGLPFAENLCSITIDTWFEILKTYSVFHHGNTK